MNALFSCTLSVNSGNEYFCPIFNSVQLNLHLHTDFSTDAEEKREQLGETEPEHPKKTQQRSFKNP